MQGYKDKMPAPLSGQKLFDGSFMPVFALLMIQVSVTV